MFAEYADLAFAVGGLVLLVGLLPALHARTIMPLTSALPIAIVLTAWLPFQWALGLEFGAATTAVQAALWWGLVVLRCRKPEEVQVSPYFAVNKRALDRILAETNTQR